MMINRHGVSISICRAQGKTVLHRHNSVYAASPYRARTNRVLVLSTQRVRTCNARFMLVAFLIDRKKCVSPSFHITTIALVADQAATLIATHPGKLFAQ